MNDFEKFITEAGNVRPTERQIRWFDMEFYGFVHFSPNTFTGLEWGTGKEDPSIFDPKHLDCDQWAEALKASGMKGAILTAKHHDGFCLWPTKYTDHNVMNSPFKRDIVKEFSEACSRAGLKFGFYLSPWDRHSEYYGTDKYNEYYKAQLTELLTGYGDVFHIWFDNACGEGENGKKQEYDWQGIIELVRKYQPDATTFNDKGADVRWCGNETATSRFAEWAVVPEELCSLGNVQTGPGPMKGDLSEMTSSDSDIGALHNIIYSKGLVFAGSEVDVSIRKGWFWHENEDPCSLDRLWEIYLKSVGTNACLNLNVPPNKDGLLDIRDVRRLKEFGDLLKNNFEHDHADGHDVKETKRISESQSVFEVELDEVCEVKFIDLAEDIKVGQRIENFYIEFFDKDTNKLVDYFRYSGTTIGHKKIVDVKREMG